MDSYNNTNLPYTKTGFSSYALSKNIGSKESRWISPSPKKKTMAQMIVSKKSEVKNNGTNNTKSLERNSLKRKSPFAISDIDSKIKRLEALHEETTTSDSDTTITKIDRSSKKRKFSKPGEESSDSEDLCKTLKSINNTVNELRPLHPFSREEDIKIIRYFHTYMELLARKDDIYVYQLLEMKYHFQRSAKFLQDRFLNEILPNLYVYDCLSLEEMVVFYDRADMFVPKHVQNLIQEKVRSITGRCISSPESHVITISDSEDEETNPSPCCSYSSPIILKRKNRVIPLSSTPSICSANTLENVLETVHNTNSGNNLPTNVASDSGNENTNVIKTENVTSPCSSESTFILPIGNNKLLHLPTSICSDSGKTVQNSDINACINPQVLSVVISDTKEQNLVRMSDSANNKSVETCQLVNDSNLSASVNLREENKYQRSVKDSENEHSDNVNRNEEVENITTNTWDMAEGSPGCILFSARIIKSSEKQVKCAKSDVQREKLGPVTNVTITVLNSNCNTSKVNKSTQTIQNGQSQDNLALNTDHTYMKLTQIVDNALDNVSETAGLDKERISIKIPDTTAETSSREQQIQPAVTSISNERSSMDTRTNTEPPGTMNKYTQLSSLEPNEIDGISCLERDAIELRTSGNSNIYVSKKVNVKKIAKQYELLENCIHLTDTKTMEILQLYANYKSNIDTAIKIFTEKDMEDDSSRYNLRKFVKKPRGGTCTRRYVNWCNPDNSDVFDHLTQNCPSKEAKNATTASRRSAEINKIFGIRQLQLGKSKMRKKINKARLSPASDQSDETVSSATSSFISDTSTASKPASETFKNLSTGIMIRKNYLKKNNNSELNIQRNKSSPINEKFHQSVSTVTSVLNKPACSGSDKPAITEISTNTSNAISDISDGRNDDQKRMWQRSESDIQINTISPSITETTNRSLSPVTSASVANKSPEDRNPENVICSIKNNFEKRVYKKLESIYATRKPGSSDESNQKKLVYIEINKNTGNILGLRPVLTSTDKKVTSDTEPCRAACAIDTIHGQWISESVNVLGSDTATNPCIDKTVSEEAISSTDSSVNAYYDMEINIFQDLPCEYDPTCQSAQNLVQNPNETVVSAGRIINSAPGECTDEYSVIKPTRTYTRKSNPRGSPCTVSVKTEPSVKLEPPDASDDSGLEMIATQLLLGSSIASTSSSANDDIILIEDSSNCILDFLVDDIKTEIEENTSKPDTNILDSIYETVPVNREDVNITAHSFSTISEADSVWCTIKRLMSILESPIVLDESEFACERVVINTQTDANITSTTTCVEERNVQIKQELLEINETIKQEWITDTDSWGSYPEMMFDCAKIKQEISILESNTLTSPYFDEEHFDPVWPVQLPSENLQTHVNMSRKLKAVVAENRLSINHLKPATETEQIIKTEYCSDGTEVE